MCDPTECQKLRDDLAAAKTEGAEFKRLYQSTVIFQGRAHDKKVQAKRDRDAVIAKNARLHQINAELTATIARLEAQLEQYA